MSNYSDYIIQAWQQTSHLEMVAVVFAILYLLLAIKESIWCWPSALVSTMIYVFLFFDVNLYMESGLQFFYIAMAIYGWTQWRQHQNKIENLKVSRWSYQQHLVALTIIATLVLISGYLLETNTDAVYPWLDSLTTWGAVITTWMVTKKILDNWIYWIVIDSLSIFLYLERELYLTALLFVIYVALCFVGYKQWHKKLKEKTF